MKSFKFATIVLALGFAFGIGCGSDSGTSPDAPVIIGGGTGGAAHFDDGGLGGAGGSLDTAAGSGGVIGTGGSVGFDAPIASGGTGGTGFDGGGVDSGIADAPLGGADGGGGSEAGTVGEAGVVTNICTGLSPAACDQAIRNAAVDNTVNAQTVPNTNPPAYARSQCRSRRSGPTNSHTGRSRTICLATAGLEVVQDWSATHASS